jgi:hypothetical protein
LRVDCALRPPLRELERLGANAGLAGHRFNLFSGCRIISKYGAQPFDRCRGLGRLEKFGLSGDAPQSLHANSCARSITELAVDGATAPRLITFKRLSSRGRDAGILRLSADRFYVVRVAGTVAMRPAGLRIFLGGICCRI